MPLSSPSLRPELLAWTEPRVRGSVDLDTVAQERTRIERWHAGLEPGQPTRAVRDTRDTVVPGCRLLVEWAPEADWALTPEPLS